MFSLIITFNLHYDATKRIYHFCLLEHRFKKPRPGLVWGTTADAHEASQLSLSWFFIPSGSVEKMHQRRTEIPCLFSYEGIPIQASKDAGLLPLPQVSAFSR